MQRPILCTSHSHSTFLFSNLLNIFLIGFKLDWTKDIFFTLYTSDPNFSYSESTIYDTVANRNPCYFLGNPLPWGSQDRFCLVKGCVTKRNMLLNKICFCSRPDYTADKIVFSLQAFHSAGYKSRLFYDLPINNTMGGKRL